MHFLEKLFLPWRPLIHLPSPSHATCSLRGVSENWVLGSGQDLAFSAKKNRTSSKMYAQAKGQHGTCPKGGSSSMPAPAVLPGVPLQGARLSSVSTRSGAVVVRCSGWQSSKAARQSCSSGSHTSGCAESAFSATQGSAEPQLCPTMGLFWGKPSLLVDPGTLCHWFV